MERELGSTAQDSLRRPEFHVLRFPRKFIEEHLVLMEVEISDHRSTKTAVHSLREAAQKDADALRQELRDAGFDEEAIDDTFMRGDEVNEADGPYDSGS